MNKFKFTIPKLIDSFNKYHSMPKLCNICLLFIITVQIFLYSRSVGSYSPVLGIALNLESSQIVELVNQQRTQYNLQNFQIDNKLNQAALLKANDMIQNNYWDHLSPNSQTPWQFITKAGYVYKYAGENLGKDYYKEEDLVTAWMQSPGHRANILNDKFTQAGIATIQGNINGKSSILVVMLYATPFSDEELAWINSQQAVIVNQTSQTYPPVSNVSSNYFNSTKLVLGVIIGLVIIMLVFDIKKQIYKMRFSLFVKRYWLNMILLISSCTLYAITTNSFPIV